MYKGDKSYSTSEFSRKFPEEAKKIAEDIKNMSLEDFFSGVVEEDVLKQIKEQAGKNIKEVDNE